MCRYRKTIITIRIYYYYVTCVKYSSQNELHERGKSISYNPRKGQKMQNKRISIFEKILYFNIIIL